MYSRVQFVREIFVASLFFAIAISFAALAASRVYWYDLPSELREGFEWPQTTGWQISEFVVGWSGVVSLIAALVGFFWFVRATHRRFRYIGIQEWASAIPFLFYIAWTVIVMIDRYRHEELQQAGFTQHSSELYDPQYLYLINALLIGVIFTTLVNALVGLLIQPEPNQASA